MQQDIVAHNPIYIKSNNLKPKLLFLDDEKRILHSLRAIFRSKYDVFIAINGREALDVLKAHQISVIITDQRMPEMTGIEFLRIAKEVSPNSLRILLTGFSDLSAIIDSINDGEVFRFLNKPWGNKEIRAVVDDAVTIALELQEQSIQDEAIAKTYTTPVTAPNLHIGTNTFNPNLSDKTSIAVPFVSADNTPKTNVLIRCKDVDLFEEIRSLATYDNLHLFHAKNQDETLLVLQDSPISVLVSILDEDNHELEENSIEFLKLLKRELPSLVTIGMSQQDDYKNVVTLINQAKVYRYISLPAKVSRILFFIKSAAEQHTKQLNKPMLLRQQKVEIKPLKGAYAEPRGIMAKLRSIRNVFFKN